MKSKSKGIFTQKNAFENSARKNFVQALYAPLIHAIQRRGRKDF